MCPERTKPRWRRNQSTANLSRRENSRLNPKNRDFYRFDPDFRLARHRNAHRFNMLRSNSRCPVTANRITANRDFSSAEPGALRATVVSSNQADEALNQV